MKRRRKGRLLAEMAGQQCDDGSWEHTAVAAVHHLEMLAESGLATISCFARGIEHLFTCVQSEVQPKQSALMLAHHRIPSESRYAEFHSAEKYQPHWIPAGACHCHLPMIQTGCALRLLNKTGYENDPRVIRACRNLIDLHERFAGGASRTFNTAGWRKTRSARQSRDKRVLMQPVALQDGQEFPN